MTQDPRHRLEGPAQHGAQRAGAGDDAGRAAGARRPARLRLRRRAAGSTSPRPRSWWRTWTRAAPSPARTPAPPSRASSRARTSRTCSRRARRSSAAAARQAVDDGKAAVAVIVPEDFSAVVFGSDPPATSQVELYENPTSEIGGSIVEGVVGQVLADFNGARAAAAGAVALRSDAAGDPPAGPGRAAPPPSSSPTPAASSAGLQISQRSPKAGATGEGGQRHRLDPRRHDDLLHVLRRGQRRAHDPHRGPRRHHAAPVHHADAARDDHRRQVRLASSSRCCVQAVVLLIAGRLIFGIQWGRLDAVVAAHAGRRRRGRRPRPARHLVRQDAGAGRRHRLRRLPGPRPARRQLHRHGADQRRVRHRAEVHAQRLAPRGLGHDHARRRRSATSAGRCWCRSGFAVAFFFFAVLRMRRRFA